MKKKLLFSIITVVYNDKKGLEKTIRSVISQTFENYEFIIVDGKSSDGTVSIIKDNSDYINHWISEKDEGIFDGMNKGIEMANGRYLNFMNAGDIFYASDVLQKVADKIKHENCDLLYGNNTIIYPSLNRYERLRKPDSLHMMWKVLPFSHQSLFTKKELMDQHPFNYVQYPNGADSEFAFWAYLNNYRFKYIPVTIAKFEAEGNSDINRLPSIREQLSMNKKYSNSLTRRFYFYGKMFREWLKQLFKRILPKRIKLKLIQATKKG